MLDNLQAEIEAIVNPVFERSDEQLIDILDRALSPNGLWRWRLPRSGFEPWQAATVAGWYIEAQEAQLEKQRKQVIETETKLALRRRQRGEE